MWLGIDTGGTFTDFVMTDGDQLRIHKVLSTPAAPEQAILRGVADMGIAHSGLYVVHGSTVATNAVLEGKGARTVLITNRGLRDVLTIGRQARVALYDLQPTPRPVPVPRDLCLETGGRLAADGTVVEGLTEQELLSVRAQLEGLRPQAVAINLLFSFLDDRFEKAIEAAVPGDIFVSRSSLVLPEYREYERGITTWLNAYVGPLVEGYLRRLERALSPARISVMQSSGGTIEAGQAGGRAVHLLLSGPAGGLAGAQYVGRVSGRQRLLTFDMGGTSTDVALLDGALRLTNEGYVGGYPVAVPMVDMHTIGAGGGSIARVDSGGLLHVGPESAGAAPGPACYGRGGDCATVTDANLVLGRLQPDAFLGGAMRLDLAAARAAMHKLSAALGTTIEAAAEGIVQVANEHMAGALRVISVQRGIDPREFTLVSFGGAGGLHVCALAEALEIRQALVPIHAGVLSALGMLAAPRARQLSRTRTGLLRHLSDAGLAEEFATLEASGRQALVAEGVAENDVLAERSLDLRYQGQAYTLNVAWHGGTRGCEDAFHSAHQARYGHHLDLAVELVNVRVGIRGPRPELVLTTAPHAVRQPRRTARLVGVAGDTAVVPREALTPGDALNGPALVTETVSTTYLAPGWRCVTDGTGNLLLEKTSPSPSLRGSRRHRTHLPRSVT